MAAGVIRNLTNFRLAFQHPFYTLTDQQEDMDFQEGSSEEEDEEEGDGEMEEEEEGEEEEEEGAGDTDAPQHSSHGTTEMTIQLLRFADLISCDIQRYFGKKSKEEDPDACEIYEDRLSSVGRSGRERYYADLMRVAQSRGREEEEEELPHALRALCSRDSIQQLGPLAELFSVGLRRYVKPGGAEHARRQKGECRHGQGVPMCKRRLPPSFWAEPAPHPTACLLSTTNTPDFSDLLANWTCESSQELQGVSSTNSPRQQTLEPAQYHIA